VRTLKRLQCVAERGGAGEPHGRIGMGGPGDHASQPPRYTRQRRLHGALALQSAASVCGSKLLQ